MTLFLQLHYVLFYLLEILNALSGIFSDVPSVSSKDIVIKIRFTYNFPLSYPTEGGKNGY